MFIDEPMELFDLVAVSAGVRGTQIVLEPRDYIRAVGGTLGPIALVLPGQP
jgi:Cys-tRNA(Pro)/Cys-tRNA(Cys) deacylase